MDENKKENNGPPYFRPETEDKYGHSLHTLEIWTEQELSKGNLEKAINFLEQAKTEANACQKFNKIELYDIYIKELRSGERISIKGDPKKRWLPHGIGPKPGSHMYELKVERNNVDDDIKNRSEELIKKDLEIIKKISQQQNIVQIKELADYMDLTEDKAIFLIKKYIHEKYFRAILFEATGTIKFLPD